MSYKQWRSLKSSIKSSMHWATPKTQGRMLENSEPLLSLSPVKDLSPTKDSSVEEDLEYEPTPYDKIGFRMGTPPPSFWKSSEEKENYRTEAKKSGAVMDADTAMKRRQFAVRRQSTIGTMVMAEKWDDNEIRRRFRNYEI